MNVIIKKLGNGIKNVIINDPKTNSVSDEPTAKKAFTDAEAKACSIEAMLNGEECEACQ